MRAAAKWNQQAIEKSADVRCLGLRRPESLLRLQQPRKITGRQCSKCSGCAAAGLCLGSICDKQVHRSQRRSRNRVNCIALWLIRFCAPSISTTGPETRNWWGHFVAAGDALHFQTLDLVANATPLRLQHEELGRDFSHWRLGERRADYD